MIIKNEKSYPMFLRYAGKARAGKDLKAGECSAQCPLDRLQLAVMQGHVRSGIISVFVTEAEKTALTGNVPKDILDALKVEEPNNRVAVEAATVEAPKVATVADVAATKAFNALMEDPIKKYAKKDKTEVTPEAPSAEVPVEEGTVENTVETVKEAEIAADAAPVATLEPAEEADEDPLQDNSVTYEFMNKQQLMDEIVKRGLRKPALSTSTAKLREILLADDSRKA